MNQGIHTVDLLLWMLGPIARVSGRVATRFHDIEVEDTAAAVLEFDNGAVGVLEASTASYPGYPRRVELTGAGGTLAIEQNRLVGVDLRNKTDLQSSGATDRSPGATSPVVSDATGHRVLLDDFFEAIAEDRAPCCDGREGRRSVAVVEAIYRSAREGAAVDVDRA
jgi:UDP-N-acetyl-2-amino-2-deoxyglucuronate dehydrogenase